MMFYETAPIPLWKIIRPWRKRENEHSLCVCVCCVCVVYWVERVGGDLFRISSTSVFLGVK